MRIVELGFRRITFVSVVLSRVSVLLTLLILSLPLCRLVLVTCNNYSFLCGSSSFSGLTYLEWVSLIIEQLSLLSIRLSDGFTVTTSCTRPPFPHLFRQHHCRRGYVVVSYRNPLPSSLVQSGPSVKGLCGDVMQESPLPSPSSVLITTCLWRFGWHYVVLHLDLKFQQWLGWLPFTVVLKRCIAHIVSFSLLLTKLNQVTTLLS